MMAKSVPTEKLPEKAARGEDRAVQERMQAIRASWRAAAQAHGGAAAERTAQRIGKLRRDAQRSEEEKAQWEGFVRDTLTDGRELAQQARRSLAGDSVRQIAALRERGEYDRADELLAAAQEYLAQLTRLEQWAAANNTDRAEFAAHLERWAAAYRLAAEQCGFSDMLKK